MKLSQRKENNHLTFEIKLPSGDLFELALTPDHCEQQFQSFCKHYKIDQDQALLISNRIREIIDMIHQKAAESKLSKKISKKPSLEASEIKSNTGKKQSFKEKSGLISKKVSKASSTHSKQDSSSKQLKTEPKLPKEVLDSKSKKGSITPSKHKSSTSDLKYFKKTSPKEQLSPPPQISTPNKPILLKDHLNDHKSEKSQKIVKKIKATITIPEHLLKKKETCDKCVKVVTVSKQKQKSLSPRPADHFYKVHKKGEPNCTHQYCYVWQHSQGEKEKPGSRNRIPIASLHYSPSKVWSKTLRSQPLSQEEPLPEKYAVRQIDEKIKNYYTNFKLQCGKIAL